MYEKQNFKNREILTAARLNALDDGIKRAVDGVFYSSVYNALNGINALESGSVHASGSTITLLADVDEAELLEIKADTTLVLNGFTLHVLGGGDRITVNEGASLYIDGTRAGSVILADAASDKMVLVRSNGTLNISGGQYSISGSGLMAAFVAASTSPAMSVHHCKIIVDGGEVGSATGIQSEAAKLDLNTVEIVANGLNATHIKYRYDAKIFSCKLTGSAIEKIECVVCYPNSVTDIIDLQITSASKTDLIHGLRIYSNATVTAKDLRISVATEAEREAKKCAYGIANSGTCTIEDSFILADAKGEHAERSMSIGIDNYSLLITKNCQVIGTHSGIQNIGDLYVERCLLSGVCHGGLYTCHSHDKSVVVNDTVLEVGVYRGEFTDAYAELFDPTPGSSDVDTYAGMYFGSSDVYNDGGDLYMDGCMFVGVGGESFVVRPAAYTTTGSLAAGQNPNRLFISRSKIAVQKTGAANGVTAPIRLNYYNSAVCTVAFSEIHYGLGCNFTADNLGAAGAADFMHSGSVYYRRNAQFMPSYEDYFSMNCDNVMLGEVSKALDKIIELQEELIGA